MTKECRFSILLLFDRDSHLLPTFAGVIDRCKRAKGEIFVQEGKVRVLWLGRTKVWVGVGRIFKKVCPCSCQKSALCSSTNKGSLTRVTCSTQNGPFIVPPSGLYTESTPLTKEQWQVLLCCCKPELHPCLASGISCSNAVQERWPLLSFLSNCRTQSWRSSEFSV